MLVKVKQELLNIKKDSKKFFKPIIGFINFMKCINDNRFEKILKLMNVIEDIHINKDNDVMLEFKNSLIIKTHGHQVYYTKDGRIISSGDMISDNPEFNLNPYIDKLDIKGLAKKDNDMYIFYMTKYINFSNFTFREKRI